MAHDINETAIGFLSAQGCKLLRVDREPNELVPTGYWIDNGLLGFAVIRRDRRGDKENKSDWVSSTYPVTTDGIVDDGDYAILYPNGEVEVPYCQRYKSVEDWAVSNDLSLIPWPDKPLSKDRLYHGVSRADLKKK